MPENSNFLNYYYEKTGPGLSIKLCWKHLQDMAKMVAQVSYLGKFAQFGFNCRAYWRSRHPNFLCSKRHFFSLWLFRNHCEFLFDILALESKSHPFSCKSSTTTLALQDGKIFKVFAEDLFWCLLMKLKVTALLVCTNKNFHLASQRNFVILK